jgi:hypothetical protein
LDYTANETSSYIVDSISYSMKTKYLLVAAFSTGFIVIIPISNTVLVFAVVIHTPQYNAGYNAACTDAKHGIEIWDTEGFIWDGFNQKYGALQNNTQWMQGYRDGAICTHQHTPLYIAGFNAGCQAKHTGMLIRDPEGNPVVPRINNDTGWMQGYVDAASYTSFCPSKVQ